MNYIFSALIKEYEQTRVIKEEELKLNLLEKNYSCEAAEFPCEVSVQTNHNDDEISVKLRFCFIQDCVRKCAVAFKVEIDNWSAKNYVFFPAAVYNGNRFRSYKLSYPPFLEINKSEALTVPTTVTDIPRLSDSKPKSKIQLLSGDISTPCIGYHDGERGKGFLILTRHKTMHGYTGLFIEEDLVNNVASITVNAPGVREGTKYIFADNEALSDDEGVLFKKDEEAEILCKLYIFDAKTISDFYSKFSSVRFNLEKGILTNTIPFSKAYYSIKEKYEKDNFAVEGYYRVGVKEEVPFQEWQAGWVGGGINSYPFLLEDGGEAYKRAISTIRFIFKSLQTRNGWIWPIYSKGRYYGDSYNDYENNPVLLLRKNSDMLYFILKQLLFLREKNNPLDDLNGSVRKLCDAYIGLWERYGQLGQFINMDTNEIIIGNTASAGITSAAMLLAEKYFGDEKYGKLAEDLGEYYYQNYVSKGLMNGCPGDICQAPDSEAAFALLESYVELYEAKQDKKWLYYACDTALQAESWVMSYDFDFPANSTCGKLQLKTMGTVFANAQNKHSAPGICTLSGNSLLKLYRFTGEKSYLELLKSISHNMAQFVSIKERPLMTLEGVYLPAGYVNERVQTSDWEGKHAIGEFQNGSNWPEVSMLLTYVEVPGVYVNANNMEVTVFDHVQCEIRSFTGDDAVLLIQNPTDYDAKVTVMLDDTRKPLGHNYFNRMKIVGVKAKQSIEVLVNSRI